MSFIEKTWHDYPPNTNTPITAAELNRIETGITGAYTAADTAQTTAVTTATGFAKNYLTDSFVSVNPGWTRSTLQKTVTLGTTDITCSVAKADFDPEVDGVMIWQGNFLFLTDYYTFDTTTDPDNVIISFAENTRTRFELDTSIEIVIYEKPPDSGGETAVVYGYLPDHRYFITPILFDGTGLTSYEICVCFRATVHPTRANAFCGGEHDYYRCPSCEMNTQGVWHGFAYNGNSWQYGELVQWADMPVTIDFTGAIQWIKLSWDSTEQKQVLSHSLDGLTFTEISSVATPPTAFIPSGNADKITLGNVSVISASHPFEVGNDINIFNSYIKINGVLVFGREVTA